MSERTDARKSGASGQPILTVASILSEKASLLKLHLLAGDRGLQRPVKAFEVNRPGLALAGHLARFRAERIQIIGRGEEDFIRTRGKEIRKNLNRILQHRDLPCVVVTRGLKPPADLVALCRKHGVPLLQTLLDTAHFVGELTPYLEERLAPSQYRHGVLVDVYGLGVMICGESGIGKSECALELLKRGHIFIADDLIRIKRLPGHVLLGEPARKELGHYLELRGLGIIDVRTLLGIGSVMDRTRIEMVVTLEMWKEGAAFAHYDRIGIDEKFIEILEVKVPHVVFPIFPGRNLAILIEVASLNQRLKSKGIYSAREFAEKILAKTKSGAVGHKP